MKRHRSDDARNNGAGPERAQRVEGMSRRDAFRTAAAIAAAPFLLRDAAAAQRPQVVENTGPSRQPILLKGGTIVSMDPKVGDFARGDVLIDGKKIVGVGDQVKAPPQAQVIDATNTIIIPGFVDAHRHSWEGQLRRIIPDGAIAEYMATTHNGFARYYRPARHLRRQSDHRARLHRRRHHLRDRQLAQLALGGSLRCGGAGAASIRAFAAFTPRARRRPASGIEQWPQDLERLQKRFFSSTDQLVTLRMFSGMDRRELGAGAAARDQDHDRVERGGAGVRRSS